MVNNLLTHYIYNTTGENDIESSYALVSRWGDDMIEKEDYLNVYDAV